MSISIPFNPLGYAKTLKAAGFTDQQAEAQAEILSETFQGQVVTKRDLEAMKKELQSEIRELELKIIIKIGAIQAIAVGVLAAIIKF